MSRNWDQSDLDEDEDQDQDQQNQKQDGLRQHLSKIEKENKALRQANATLEAQVRQQGISQALTAKGIDSKIAKLVPADVDATPEAIDKWLEEYGELLVPKAPEVKPPQDGKPPGALPEDDDVDDAEMFEYIRQMGRMATVDNGGKPPTKEADILSKVRDPNTSREQLLRMVEAAGGGIGSG